MGCAFGDILADRINRILAENGEGSAEKGSTAYYMLGVIKNNATFDIMNDFCEEYGCSTDYLLGRSDVYSVLGQAAPKTYSKLSTQDDYKQMQLKAKYKEMYIDREMTLVAMSKELGIPKTTLYNRLKAAGIIDEKKKLDAIKKGEWQG